MCGGNNTNKVQEQIRVRGRVRVQVFHWDMSYPEIEID